MDREHRQESRRGDYIDLCQKWLKFDPRCYHAVERVISGRRGSLALFSPRAWCLMMEKDSSACLKRTPGLTNFSPGSAGSEMLPDLGSNRIKMTERS